jgi:hypothetical protein
MYSNWWNEDWQGKPKYSEKTRPAPLCPPQIPLDQSPGRRGGRPSTNRLSYSATLYPVSLNLTEMFILANKKFGEEATCSYNPYIFFFKIKQVGLKAKQAIKEGRDSQLLLPVADLKMQWKTKGLPYVEGRMGTA